MLREPWGVKVNHIFTPQRVSRTHLRAALVCYKLLPFLIYDPSNNAKLLLFLPGSVEFTDWLAGRSAHKPVSEAGMLSCAIALGRATIAPRNPCINRCKK